MIAEYLKCAVPVCQDLATLDAPPAEIAISGQSRNTHLLSQWPQIDRVWLVHINQKSFDSLIPLLNPVSLVLYDFRSKQLDALAGFTRITELSLQWNPKVKSLRTLEKLTGLRTLVLNDLPKISRLDPITHLTQLEALDLGGGIWADLQVNTLAPLSFLVSLRWLVLRNITAMDQSLAPLYPLHTLEHLELPNLFPTREYIKLSLALPHVDCAMFSPYVTLPQPLDDKDIMVVGRRKPFLNSQKDKARLEAYCLKFEALRRSLKSRDARYQPQTVC